MAHMSNLEAMAREYVRLLSKDGRDASKEYITEICDAYGPAGAQKVSDEAVRIIMNEKQ